MKIVSLAAMVAGLALAWVKDLNDFWLWGALLAVALVLWAAAPDTPAPQPKRQPEISYHPTALFLSALAGNAVEYRFGKLMKSQHHAAWTHKIGPFTLIPQQEQGGHSMVSRDYPTVKEWRRRIQSMIQGAALIVVQVGPKPTLLWELTLIVSYAPPTEVLLVLPSSRQSYVAFRRWSARLFPHRLPAEPPPHRLLAFHAGWIPYAGHPRQHTSLPLTVAITARGRHHE